MYQSARNTYLEHAKLAQLRPTQVTVGYAEVELKSQEWAQLVKRQRKAAIARHVFPAVLGPGKEYFITDHHHLGVALLKEGIKQVLVAVLDDLSWLTPTVFWRTLEFRSWTHPYDDKGNRRKYVDMPKKLSQLKDDPYRSLAGLVRNAGGYAKDQEPFVEFMWADYFRPLVDAGVIKKEPKRAEQLGLRFAQANEARYLPGWSGKPAV